METILHGGVGLLTARSGGHLVSLQCYLSPFDIFEEGPDSQLNSPDGIGKCTERVDHFLYLERIRMGTNIAMTSHLIV